MKTCNYCNALLKDEYKVCPNCGMPVGGNQYHSFNTNNNVPDNNQQYQNNNVGNYNQQFQNNNVPNYAAQYQYIQNNTTNKVTTIGFIISLVSLFLLPFILGVLGLCLGCSGLSQINKNGEKGKGLAIASIVIGAISIVYAIVVSCLR